MIRKVLFLILLYSMAFSCKNNKPEEMKIEENTGINNMVTALSYLDETNPKYHELEFIREENYFNTENSSSARNFYSKDMEFYNKMEYEKSIDTFILAGKDYTFPIIY